MPYHTLGDGPYKIKKPYVAPKRMTPVDYASFEKRIILNLLTDEELTAELERRATLKKES